MLAHAFHALFQHGGVRTIIRAVAWIGLFLSPLALVQHLMPVPIVDSAWGLTSRGLRPFGPFVNRNYFAGWLIMAIPLTIGFTGSQAFTSLQDLALFQGMGNVSFTSGLAMSVSVIATRTGPRFGATASLIPGIGTEVEIVYTYNAVPEPGCLGLLPAILGVAISTRRSRFWRKR